MKTPLQVRIAGMKDGRKKLHLEITKDDIKRAKPLDPSSCAAACALKRQGFVEAIVMRSTTYVNCGTKESPSWERYATPPSLQREIVALDRGGRFEPGDYIIQPFTPTRKLGEKYWASRGKKTGTSTPSFRHVTANIREG